MSDYDDHPLPGLAKPDLAAQHLAELLSLKELTLLIGAGVSASAGLPDWQKLVEGCEAELGLDSPPDRSATELMRAIDRVERQLKKSGLPLEIGGLVRQNLYTDEQLSANTYPLDILSNRMLIALGALVMASARGSIGDIITLNFDDLLEWYLHLHGFRTQVISEFPVDLRGNVDVAVFHPHGFAPLVTEAHEGSDWLVLSYQDLVKRLAAGAEEPWPTLLASRFMTKRILIVGTSMSDLDIDVILARARAVKRHSGPLGYYVAKGISADRAEELIEANIVPVSLESYDAIPDFLLKICQLAAAD